MLFYINFLGGLFFAVLVPLLIKWNTFLSDKLADLAKNSAQGSARQFDYLGERITGIVTVKLFSK
jgi:hypothetical protein